MYQRFLKPSDHNPKTLDLLCLTVFSVSGGQIGHGHANEAFWGDRMPIDYATFGIITQQNVIIVLHITRLFLHSQIDMSLPRAGICRVLAAPEIWISAISMAIKQKGALFIFILRWEWRQAFAAGEGGTAYSGSISNDSCYLHFGFKILINNLIIYRDASIGHLHIPYPGSCSPGPVVTLLQATH